MIKNDIFQHDFYWYSIGKSTIYLFSEHSVKTINWDVYLLPSEKIIDYWLKTVTR